MSPPFASVLKKHRSRTREWLAMVLIAASINSLVNGTSFLGVTNSSKHLTGGRFLTSALNGSAVWGLQPFSVEPSCLAHRLLAVQNVEQSSLTIALDSLIGTSAHFLSSERHWLDVLIQVWMLGISTTGLGLAVSLVHRYLLDPYKPRGLRPEISRRDIVEIGRTIRQAEIGTRNIHPAILLSDPELPKLVSQFLNYRQAQAFLKLSEREMSIFRLAGENYDAKVSKALEDTDMVQTLAEIFAYRQTPHDIAARFTPYFRTRDILARASALAKALDALVAEYQDEIQHVRVHRNRMEIRFAANHRQLLEIFRLHGGQWLLRIRRSHDFAGVRLDGLKPLRHLLKRYLEPDSLLERLRYGKPIGENDLVSESPSTSITSRGPKFIWGDGSADRVGATFSSEEMRMQINAYFSHGGQPLDLEISVGEELIFDRRLNHLRAGTWERLQQTLRHRFGNQPISFQMVDGEADALMLQAILGKHSRGRRFSESLWRPIEFEEKAATLESPVRRMIFAFLRALFFLTALVAAYLLVARIGNGEEIRPIPPREDTHSRGYRRDFSLKRQASAA